LPFGKWFFPIVPAIYLLIKLMIITYLIADDPNRIWHAIVVFGGAYCLYLFNRFLEKGKAS